MLNHHSLVNLLLRSTLILTTSGLAVVFGNCAFAQIQPDSALGTQNSIVNDIDALNKLIDGGVRLDANLFHSFQEFNVSEGGSVYFANPQGITDIFSRVTGSNPSNIFGKLGVLGDANLFLINPNGIVFGENASLDVGGSFVASTANGIEFGNRGLFSASNPETPLLLNVNPSALFFNQVAAANITVRSVAPAGTSPSGIDVVGLRVPDGSSFLLVGGDVNFEGGQSSALGGHLELAGLKEPGSINLQVDDKTLKLGFPNDVLLANVTLKDDARASVRGDGGGNLVVNADTFNATSGGRLVAGTEKPVKGGDITVNANNFIITGIGSSGNSSGLYNQTLVDAVGSPGNIVVNAKILDASSNARIQNSINTASEGNAGNIDISADFLSLRNGAQITTSNFGQGNSGNIEINADTLELIDISANGQFRSAIASETYGANSQAKAGSVTLNTRNLNLRDGGLISASTFDEGAGGNIEINADTLELIDISANGQFRSAIASETYGANSQAKAGNVTLNTRILNVRDGAIISNSTNNQGNGGNLQVNADILQIIGVSENGQFPSAIGSETRGVNSQSKAGNVTLNTRILNIRDGGIISTQTFNRGNGGNLIVTATESLNIAGIAPSNLPNFQFFLSALSTSTSGSGEAGSLKIVDTGTIIIEDGGEISASTFGEGAGGNIEINADTLELIGVSENGLFPSTLSNATYITNSSAKAGNITLNTRMLNIRDGGIISTQTFNQGKGGDLTISARELLNIAGFDPNTSSNQFFISSLSTRTFGSGEAGSLKIVDTGKITIEDGGQISTSSSNQGNGGNIEIDADTLELVGVSSNGLFPSGIDNETSGINSQARAGNVTLNTRMLNIRDGGLISTRTFNQGAGGNIEINADTIEIIGVSTNGQFSSALGSETRGVDSSGQAGNVTLNSRILNLRDGGFISTQTSNRGKGGDLTVKASESLNISGFVPNDLPDNSSFISGLFTSTRSIGEAGNLKISDTETIKIEDGGQISASNFNQGAGGSIEIDADIVEIIGVSTTGGQSPSSIGSETRGVNSKAKAGDITLKTQTLNIRDGAVLSTLSTNQGLAGNITIQNSERIQLTNGNILTASDQSSGGAINITAKDIRLFGDSDIRTNVFSGAGGGGNINLTANTIIALDDSDIFSFAGDGKGGDITFNTQAFFSKPLYNPSSSANSNANALTELDNNNRVDVNASGTVSGTITGVPDTTFIQDSLTDLPDNQIDTNTIIANSCVVRSNQQNGTFLITGSGGLPINPSDAPLSSYSTGSIRSIPSNPEKSPASTTSQSWRIGDPVVEPQGVYKLPNGQLVLSRECK